MKTILIAMLLLIDILKWIILIDVVLSWLSAFGVRLRFKFIADMIDQIYKKIKKLIPTTFGPFEFVPIVLLIILLLIQQLIYAYDIELVGYYRDLLNF